MPHAHTRMRINNLSRRRPVASAARVLRPSATRGAKRRVVVQRVRRGRARRQARRQARCAGRRNPPSLQGRERARHISHRDATRRDTRRRGRGHSGARSARCQPRGAGGDPAILRRPLTGRASVARKHHRRGARVAALSSDDPPETSPHRMAPRNHPSLLLPHPRFPDRSSPSPLTSCAPTSKRVSRAISPTSRAWREPSRH